MDDAQKALKFAEGLIEKETNAYCSELQHQILAATLQGKRKTYRQIADECGYSPKYIKQGVAPKLWQLLSKALAQKVTKANVCSILEKEMRKASTAASDRAPLQIEHPAANHPAPDHRTAESSLLILLVDDQPKNLRLLSDLLEEQGYSVCQAIDGEVALEAIALHKPDLVLLDISMPGMDGYSVCQQIKANPAHRDISVIFISALDEAWDKVKAFSVGGNDYITKPFKVVEVLARVKNQLKVQQFQKSLTAKTARLQLSNQELRRLSVLDEVTQISSRQRFDTYLQTCWQQAKEEALSVGGLLCEILPYDEWDDDSGYEREANSLKPVGRKPVEDNILYQVATTIAQSLQDECELLARYGPVSFAAIFLSRSPAQLQSLSATLLKQTETLRLNTDQLVLSVGIGIAQPSSQIGIESFLELCDRDLEAAKDKGNSVIIGI